MSGDFSQLARIARMRRLTAERRLLAARDALVGAVDALDRAKGRQAETARRVAAEQAAARARFVGAPRSGVDVAELLGDLDALLRQKAEAAARVAEAEDARVEADRAWVKARLEHAQAMRTLAKRESVASRLAEDAKRARELRLEALAEENHRPRLGGGWSA